ncbi:hypothetical protein AZE42_12817 [Rhizopogon vesiculosus]|uniref:Uncharacterized protein n=1 Tax=Rhizopogon vesiculosus TaxID=180088 RepID=A0A1J8QJE3_9AGAM|nr:hypothetical protein AZE42_12817 [Rhizopogon vesiculosus]
MSPMGRTQDVALWDSM